MLPNVGYNYIEASEMRRAYVVDPQPPYDKIPSSNPVALTSNGSLKGSGVAPDILYRRVHAEVAFEPLFGTPPF